MEILIFVINDMMVGTTYGLKTEISQEIVQRFVRGFQKKEQ
jgi:hypothetical protein